MAYSTRNNISEKRRTNENLKTATAQFADNRTSAATQLKQQALMAASPTATAQRAAVNTMNASAVQQQKIIQRAAPEEELQMKSVHPAAQLATMDEEELFQGKFETAQRAEDEELLQGKFETVQRAKDEELLQGKFEPAQRAEKPNNTGLPDNLKSGIENLSGMSMDHVKVHYNSDKPAQLQAHAYAQGSEIHLAPGQEQHLPHEAWHVVQQAQGRVRPTVQMKGNVQVNDDVGLEREADFMGGEAAQLEVDNIACNAAPRNYLEGAVTQRVARFIPSPVSSPQIQTPLPRKAQCVGESQSVVQRLINFGDGWLSWVNNTDSTPAQYKKAHEEGNIAGLKELEVAALRTSKINDIAELIDYTGHEATVTIRQGIHSDDTGGRELAHHQTVNVTVNKSTWSYHVFYEAGGNAWKFHSFKQENKTAGNPAFAAITERTLYPADARTMDNASLYYDRGGINSGVSTNVGPIVYKGTGQTAGNYSEITIFRCPRYVGQEGQNRWISTSKIE